MNSAHESLALHRLPGRLTFLTTGIVRWVIDWFFGYDFFISYAHSDGHVYPRLLLESLQKVGFRTFLDEQEYKPGDDLRVMTRRRVRHSTHLVIIGQSAALTESKWVPIEVDVYLKRQQRRGSSRRPIIININGALEAALDLPREKAKLAHTINDNDWLWVAEEGLGPDGRPTEDTLTRLKGAFDGVRQDTKRMRVFEGVILILTTVTIWALVERHSANTQAAIALTRQLVVEANTTPPELPVKRVLLASEAVSAAAKAPPHQLNFAVQALRDSMSRVSGEVLIPASEGMVDALVTLNERWLVMKRAQGGIEIWNMETVEALRQVVSGYANNVSSWTTSIDSQLLLTGDHQGQLRLWNIDTFSTSIDSLLLYTFPDAVDQVVIDYQSHRAFASDQAGTMVVVDLRTRQSLVLQENGPAVVKATFFRDGSKLATTSAHAERVRLWQLDTGAELSSVIGVETYNEGIDHLAVSINDRWLTTLESTYEDDVVSIWDLSTPNAHKPVVQLEGHPDQPGGLKMSPDGRWLMMASLDHTLKVYDLAIDAPFKSPILLQGQDSWAPELWKSFDGGQLLTAGGYTGKLEVWDLLSDSPSTPVKYVGQIPNPASVTGSAEGKWFAAGSSSGEIVLADMTEKDPSLTLQHLRGHEFASEVLAISDRFDWVLSASRSKDRNDGSGNLEVRLWRLSNEHPRASKDIFHIGNEIQLIAVDRRDRLFANSDDRNVHVFESHLLGLPHDPKVLRDNSIEPEGQFARGAYGIRVMAISHNGEWLATGGHGAYGLLWDLTASPPGTPFNLIDSDTGYYGITALAFSSDDTYIVAGYHSGLVSVWQPRKVDQIEPIGTVNAPFYIRQLAISGDNRFLAVVSDGGNVSIWDLNSIRGDATAPFYELPEKARMVKFMPKGGVMVIRTDKLEIWKTGELRSDWQMVHQQSFPMDSLRVHLFSGDGQWLVTAGNGEVRLWKYDPWQNRFSDSELLLNKLQGDSFSTLAFHNREILAAGTTVGNVLVWHFNNGRPLTAPIRLRGHKSNVTALQFSTSGSHVFSGSEDGTVRLWDLRLNSLLDRAHRFVGRNLTKEEWAFHFADQEYSETFPARTKSRE